MVRERFPPIKKTTFGFIIIFSLFLCKLFVSIGLQPPSGENKNKQPAKLQSH